MTSLMSARSSTIIWVDPVLHCATFSTRPLASLVQTCQLLPTPGDGTSCTSRIHLSFETWISAPDASENPSVVDTAYWVAPARLVGALPAGSVLARSWSARC